MQISRAAEYAVRAMLYVAVNGAQGPVTTSQVSEAQDIPKVFLTKILQHLGRVGLAQVYRGVGGGITLGRPAEEISLLHIIEAIDGPVFLNRCLMRPGECPREPVCPVHEVWGNAQTALMAVVEKSTLSALAARGKELAAEQAARQAPSSGTWAEKVQ